MIWPALNNFLIYNFASFHCNIPEDPKQPPTTRDKGQGNHEISPQHTALWHLPGSSASGTVLAHGKTDAIHLLRSTTSWSSPGYSQSGDANDWTRPTASRTWWHQLDTWETSRGNRPYLRPTRPPRLEDCVDHVPPECHNPSPARRNLQLCTNINWITLLLKLLVIFKY